MTTKTNLYQKPFKDGKHIVTVTKVVLSSAFFERKMTEYFELRFENVDGQVIHQKIWNNEDGRKFYIDPIFDDLV